LNSLSCTGTDADGATASAGSGPVQIDSVAPTVTIVLSAPVVPRGGTLTVTASATDATSGVATTTCGSPVTTSIGVFPVMCQAADLAGNVASAVAYYQVVAPYDLAVTAPATTERPDSFTVTARLSDYTGAGVPGVSAASTVTVRLGSGRTVTLHYRPVSDTFTGVVTVPRTAALGPTPLSATATSSGRSLASASRSVLVLAR
jgi:hypothetical protein